VGQHFIAGGFEGFPIRYFSHPDIGLIDILLVEKGVDRAQGGAKQIVAVIVEFGFALDPTVNLAHERRVGGFG
jgi:hypothetical protein